MTKAEIVAIARKNGEYGFTVSLRYRDDRLRKKCRELVREGRLIGGRRQGSENVFYFAKPAEPLKP